MRKVTLFVRTFVLCAMGALSVLTSCSDNDTTQALPTITLDKADASYTVKIGKTLRIAPKYENVEDAVFAWKVDGKEVSTDSVLVYDANGLGDKYATLQVINDAGEAYAEMKISVVKKTKPTISLIVPDEGYTIVKGSDLALKPTVDNTDGTTYSWTVNGSSAATTLEYTFNTAATGSYNLTLTATNEDGSDAVSVPVKVCNPEDMPFSWTFDKTVYNMSTGRSIKLQAYDVTNDFNADYTWTVDGTQKQTGKSASYIFSETKQGAYTVVVTMKNAYAQESKTLTVNVCPPEGTYKRTATASSSDTWNKVYEFLAAPGQFVNQGYNATTMEQANEYAASRLKRVNFVSLGAYGGYIVLGFDHSIENDGDYNLEFYGNSFKGSSEPGIVWVMQDENGNGLPDDTWYELKGSAYDQGLEVQDYAVTYYKPKAPGMSVQWKDNKGGQGSVDYLMFHQQDYYYPNWVSTDSYVLRGSKLAPRTRETSPGYWSNDEFEWGYVDNFSPIDRLTGDINYGAAPNGNHMKISNAVTYDGKPANLKYVDFVKVQTGLQTKAGWLGENSTEVFNAKDFNMVKKNK
jgi:hypothetical protein